MTFTLPGFDLSKFIRETLAEDLGKGLPGGGRDVTSESVIPAEARFSGVMDSRDVIVVAGLPLAEAFFRHLDPDCRIEALVADGDQVPAGTDLMRLTGNARAMLTAERSALNTVQHLSGIATMARRYVDAIAGTGAILLDTRKTIPGLRLAQKYAVKCGGGDNHRIGLFDAILIKENHILAAGGIAPVLAAAGSVAAASGHCKFVQIEVENLDELRQALDAGAKMVLLDNMSLDDMREAVRLAAGRAVLEASGGIGMESLRAIAETGVDRISIGGLTKDVRALDLSMRFSV